MWARVCAGPLGLKFGGSAAGADVGRAGPLMGFLLQCFPRDSQVDASLALA